MVLENNIIKIILGLTSIDKGSIKTASNLKLVIFHSMNLKGMAMILCYTHFVKVNVSEDQARHILAHFMFYGKDVFKKLMS